MKNKNTQKSPYFRKNKNTQKSVYLKKNKKANVLTENVIFIILNLVFLFVLVLFLILKTSDSASLEERYSKQIALMIDSAKPGTLIKINMQDAKKISEKNNIGFEEVVGINGNNVFVKLNDKGGHEYSFFNNVDVNAFPDGNNAENYIIKIIGYK